MLFIADLNKKAFIEAYKKGQMNAKLEDGSPLSIGIADIDYASMREEIFVFKTNDRLMGLYNCVTGKGTLEVPA